MAKMSYTKLKDGAPGWLKNSDAELSSKRVSPNEIIYNCMVFLSAAGVISKILFAGKRSHKKIKSRCENLRKLMGIGELPILNNLSVRNSFEHIDERFDDIFSDLKAKKITPLNVIEDSTSADELILKRFDPKELSISFSKHSLSLEDCMVEIIQVESKIRPALAQIENYGLKKFELWAPYPVVEV